MGISYRSEHLASPANGDMSEPPSTHKIFGDAVLFPFQEQLWTAAVEEAGLDQENLTDFARWVPKYPGSVLKKFLALSADVTKRHNFIFQGSVTSKVGNSKRRRRKWALDFAKQNFQSSDFLRITDATEL